jgi:hypothetical protein
MSAEKLLAEMVLQMEELRTEIKELRSLLSPTTAAEGWMFAKEATAALKSDGLRSIHHLQRIRLDGGFSEQRGEIRNVSKGLDRPTWQYNIPKCRQALNKYFKKTRIG